MKYYYDKSTGWITDEEGNRYCFVNADKTYSDYGFYKVQDINDWTVELSDHTLY